MNYWATKLMSSYRKQNTNSSTLYSFNIVINGKTLPPVGEWW